MFYSEAPFCMVFDERDICAYNVCITAAAAAAAAEAVTKKM